MLATIRLPRWRCGQCCTRVHSSKPCAIMLRRSTLCHYPELGASHYTLRIQRLDARFDACCGTKHTQRLAAAGEDLWLPNTTRPPWLDGSLPGDRGFDPLGLAKPTEYLQARPRRRTLFRSLCPGDHNPAVMVSASCHQTVLVAPSRKYPLPKALIICQTRTA